MRDFLPSLPHKYEPAKDWVVTQEYRERTLALKREADRERWSRGTKNLEMLEVGTPVLIQNQTGNNPTKWDKTGVVLENKPHSQVLVRVDGSRRVTLRNRRFIRELNPSLVSQTPQARVPHRPVRKRLQRKKLPETSPTVQENLPEQQIPAVPRDPSPVGVQPRVPSSGGVQVRDPSPVGAPDYHEVIHTVPDIASPPLYTPYQALQGLNEQPADGGVDDDVVVETPPTQQTPEVDEPPTPNMTRPRRATKPNPKYSPEVYDVSHVGIKSRTRSRRSVRRAGK